MAARLLFFTALLAAGVAAAQGESQQPAAPDASRKDSRLSQRQTERIAQQKRLIDCNRQAREKQMKGAVRQDFTRECMKGDDNAAVGGGQAK